MTNGFPSQGVRIPYQEYIALGKNTEGIVCRPPNGLMLPFSYVAEHVSDGQAVSTVLAIIKTIEQVRSDGFVSGAWEDAISWCNTILDEVWSGRGAYPGLGSVLRYLGFSRAHSYQATKLVDLERSGKDPWKFVLSILQGREDPPNDHYREGLLAAAGQWRLIPSRHSLLESLTHFELTTDQVTGVANEDLREKRGIFASPANIVKNPYLLFEQDRGSQNSEPIGLETIDQGMWPEGDAALFRSEQPVAHNDRRRVRATAYGVLREAANKDGHTLLPFEAFIKAVHSYFPDKRRCLLDREAILEGEDRKFYEMILWLKNEPYPDTWRTSAPQEEAEADIEDELAEDLGDEDEDSNPAITLVALKSVRRQEVEIAKVISENVRGLGVTELPNWRSLLTQDVDKGGFGEPQTPRENDAIEEKVRALQVLYSQRVSVLTGGAGTGKTSVLRVFLEQLRAIEGFTATLLAAPTGKARVRLEAATKRPANTIHQVLHRAEMLVENYRILDQKPDRGRIIYRNLVIDESSMPSVELLAALFRAVDTNAFKRLIFVGDPFQLPPIGPGRPFVDMLQWMSEEHPECIAELKTCMRVTQTTSGVSFSKGLELAGGYRDESGPGDDAILSDLVKAGEIADVRISFWNDHADLMDQIGDVLKSQFGIVGDDVEAFDRSLGIDTEWLAAMRELANSFPYAYSTVRNR
ncbi:MAG: AAA family ATPase [Acidobacteriota bacterium]